ncbi:hypothetical protein AXI64_gp085 [Vibrio phage qdvp001]|uniref:hypothetical protein n=1 Tax=Vibrio phage qdvp001 TaxID=1003177 RepID=UPI000722DFEB|nr:hypothetical protein AXI64_gp085 [Vibrio phage qdvp001]ALM62077.1 hypothetical protein qdvp001_085 [Vibrio phage qdvp001]
MLDIEPNLWLDFEEVKKVCDIQTYGNVQIEKVMFGLFDENIEEGKAVASIKFKTFDGVETSWYHPPKY